MNDKNRFRILSETVFTTKVFYAKGRVFVIITSRENKIFKTAKILKTAKGRTEKGMFMIEGLRSVHDTVMKGASIECIIIKDGTSLSFSSQCPVYTFAPKLFAEISETVTPQGVIALCHIKENSLDDVLSRGKNCVIMCEKLQDPGNIGTLIRTAHAAFCGGVVLTKGSCDLYNPKIVRATMSGIFSLPIVQNVESKSAIEYFRQNGYKIVAGALTDVSLDFYAADLSGKVLIIIGNEGNGVEEETLALCDSVVKIPMSSDAESLNAAVAGSIMMYEHYRQNIKKLKN